MNADSTPIAADEKQGGKGHGECVANVHLCDDTHFSLIGGNRR
ncbi:hypothetical protein [Usitatibacter palustris]|nr:hypothetical protein [Usitatibacter palustris]